MTEQNGIHLIDGGIPRDLQQAVDEDKQLQMSSRALARPMSRGEAVKYITSACMQLGKKIYDEIATEHAEKFAQQESILLSAMRREFEARTLKGRWRALIARWRKPTGPTLTEDASDAVQE